jgi:protein TonB
MSAAVADFRFPGLPWDGAQADRRRFLGWLRICGTIALVAGAVVPWLPLPAPPPVVVTTPAAAPIEISLVAPRRLPPPPPPPVVRPRQVQELPPATTASTRSGDGAARPGGGTRGATNPAPGNVPDGDPAADARSVAASSGLFAASGALSGLRGAVDQQKLASSGTRATGVGTAATIDRSILRSRHGTRSAGVSEGALSDATGGVALAGRGTTRVGMPGGTGDGYGGTGAGAGGTGSGTGFGTGTGGSGTGGSGNGSGGSGSGSGTGTGQRSIEDIRRVFDANKGAIFAIYHRALRTAPDLRGQVVLELLIAPGGTVTEIRVVSSELGDPALVERVVGRVRMFDFGAQEVVPTRISYPVHFLPG